MKRAIAVLGFLLAATPVMAAEAPHAAICVRVELLDRHNLPVAVQSPVVGLMVGDTPIVPEVEYPPHVSKRPGTPAPCPANLVETVAQNYKDSCLTAERRESTALTNSAPLKAVEERCNVIRTSLGESLIPYLK